MGRPSAEASRGTGVLDDAAVGRRVVRGGALRMGAFAASNILAAVGALFLLRYLGVDDFGRYGTVIALLAIVQGVTDAGLTTTGSRELALRDPIHRRELLAHIVAARLALTTVGVGLAVGFSVIAGYGSTLVLGTALAGFGIVLSSVQAALILPLSVELRNGAIAANEVIRQGALVAGFAVLVVVGARLTAFFAVQIVVGLVLLAMVPALVGRGALLPPRWSRAALWDLARVGLPIAVAAVIGVIYFRILVIVVSLIEDARDTGLFVTSTRIFELAAGLPMVLAVLTLPVLSVAARDDRERLRYVTQRASEVMFIGGIAVALGIAFGARPILRILGGAQYVAAAPILQLQCLALVTVFVGAAWTPALIGLGRLRALAIASTAGLVTVVVAGLVLVPAMGPRGGGVAAILADLVLATLNLAALRRAGIAGVLQPGFVARLLLATGLAVAVGLVPAVPQLLRALLAAATLVAAATVLRIVPSEVRDAARRGRPEPG